MSSSGHHAGHGHAAHVAGRRGPCRICRRRRPGMAGGGTPLLQPVGHLLNLQVLGALDVLSPACVPGVMPARRGSAPGRPDLDGLLVVGDHGLGEGDLRGGAAHGHRRPGVHGHGWLVVSRGTARCHGDGQGACTTAATRVRRRFIWSSSPRWCSRGGSSFRTPRGRYCGSAPPKARGCRRRTRR